MEPKKNKENASDTICPIRDILCHIGDKWPILILVTLRDNGTMRFGEIHKHIEDISQRMLTVTLRSLEADGLILREVFASVPPKVQYSITPRGASLMPHIDNLVDWALANRDDIASSRSIIEKGA